MSSGTWLCCSGQESWLQWPPSQAGHTATLLASWQYLHLPSLRFLHMPLLKEHVPHLVAARAVKHCAVQQEKLLMSR